MDKHSIVEKIKDGKDAILEELYVKYRQEFISWVQRKYQCDPEDAKDIYQFYILNNRLTSLTSSIKTYLFAIGKNKALEINKKGKRFQLIENHKYDQLTDEITLDSNFEKNLKIVTQCLEMLGDPCNTILQLYYYYKKSMEDIMLRMDYKNTDTVKNQKYKCMNRLRKLFYEKINNQ